MSHAEKPDVSMVNIFVFGLATLAKAWEPLSVAYAAPDQGVSFACLLVLCEALKLCVTLLPLAAFGDKGRRTTADTR